MTEYKVTEGNELVKLPESEEAITYEDLKLLAETDYYSEAAKLAKAQVKHEQANTRVSLHNLAESQRMSAWEQASSTENRTYHFAYQFHQSSCSNLAEYLTRWARLDISAPVEIVLTSPGGDVMHGMGLLDHTLALRQEGLHVVMKVRGVAASMAATYLQAADERVMGPASSLLVHKASAELEGTLDQLKDMQAWMEATHEQIIDLFVQRTGQTRRVVAGWFDRRDSPFTAEQALKVGLIDRIG